MKPVDLVGYCMMHSSTQADLVFDPFLGSGTTLIAAEQLGRRCYAMELCPAFVDVAVKRWQTATGNAATLHEDGRTFVEIAAERTDHDGRQTPR